MEYTYDMENSVLPLSQHREFGTLGEAEDFLFGAADDHGIRLRTVEWGDISGASIIGFAEQGGTIVLDPDRGGLNVITLLHELAHVADDCKSGHGDPWVRWFAYLLRQEVSVTAEAAFWWGIRNF